MKKFSLIIILLITTLASNAQQSFGTSGLLTTPTAEMQEDKLFRMGTNYMPVDLTPDYWDYNTANYFFNLTFLPFMEVTFRCTFIKLSTGKINQDRSITLRLRAVKERKYVPAIVLGSNDIVTSSELGFTDFSAGNKYFASVYIVATKHFKTKVGTFGANIGVIGAPTREAEYDIFYGANYVPKFAPWLTFMGEVNDDSKVNLGASAILFKHLGVHAFCYDFKNFSAGLRYEIILF